MFKLFKQTSYSSDQALLENKARPDQLPFFLNFLHNFSLSLQFPSPQPSPLLPQPVHDERKALLAATEGLLTTTAPLQGLMHFLTQHIQGNVAAQSHLHKFPVFQEERSST